MYLISVRICFPAAPVRSPGPSPHGFLTRLFAAGFTTNALEHTYV